MNETPPIPSLYMVDDNAQLARAMERHYIHLGQFRWFGWSPDPVAAVPMIIELQPDVVLLDVEIPGADSFAVLRALVSKCPSSRVVMFSGHTQASLIERALQEGAAGYIIKDDDLVTIAELLLGAARGECVLSPTASSVYMRAGGGSV